MCDQASLLDDAVELAGGFEPIERHAQRRHHQGERDADPAQGHSRL